MGTVTVERVELWEEAEAEEAETDDEADDEVESDESDERETTIDDSEADDGNTSDPKETEDAPPNAVEGDEVTLLGRDGEDLLGGEVECETAEEVADKISFASWPWSLAWGLGDRSIDLKRRDEGRPTFIPAETKTVRNTHSHTNSSSNEPGRRDKSSCTRKSSSLLASNQGMFLLRSSSSSSFSASLPCPKVEALVSLIRERREKGRRLLC